MSLSFPSRHAAARLVAAVAIISITQFGARTQSVLSTSAADINTTGYEDSPFLSADGQSFYFMYTPWTIWPVFFGRPPYVLGPERAGHRINPDRNPWEDSDIYVSRREPDGSWSAPEGLGFNDNQADCCAMTWNGTLFAYQRTQRPSSALTDIYFVELVDGTWVRTSAGANVNDPTASESNPHLSADGMTLYFTSNRAGGFGGHDLWQSSRQADGSWAPPVNLGSTFNTVENEDQIWVSRDGRTAYFNREPGPTIMVSTRQGYRWSRPAVVKFGTAVPPAAEVSVTDDGQLMVFAEVHPEVEDIVFVKSRRVGTAWRATTPFSAP